MATETKNIEQELCTKVRVLVDAKVVIDPGWLGIQQTEEARAAAIERWAQEFREFLKDHRSQDANSVTVERQYEVQCNKCGREWEEEHYDSDDKYHCAGCGRTIEVVR